MLKITARCGILRDSKQAVRTGLLFSEFAEKVEEFHFFDRAGRIACDTRVGDHDREALSTRYRDIDTILIEYEREAA